MCLEEILTRGKAEQHTQFGFAPLPDRISLSKISISGINYSENLPSHG
jgi:hypothetical protein